MLQVLKKIKLIRVNRCYQLLHFQVEQAELHVFCNASSKAYSAFVYWRFSTGDNRYHISLIMGKNKLVPIKINSTIPRLELQAALVAVRIAETIENEHEFTIT